MELKIFCTTKGNSFYIENATLRMGENLCNYTSDKGLIMGIHRELKKLSFTKINDPMKKWAKELNRAFSKEKSKCLKNT
jgi:hypothetical protein